MPCTCYIIPRKVLIRLSRDKSLSARQRKSFATTAKFELEWRKARTAQSLVSQAAHETLLSGGAIAPKPAITVYNANHGTTVPGLPISNPAKSKDPDAKQVFSVTTDVATFYQAVFGRNSVDNEGKTLMSSLHYSIAYNNAFWNGGQMVYGDGDGQIFADFTRGTDVIGHELTHGVTQYSLGLAYADEPGGLNESISDCFGSMFRQWRLKQNVHQADWLIGRDIMGPAAKAKGYTCLRDMANPAAKHCLSAQPTRYSQIKPGMDPHDSSGVPNLAFCRAAVALGGNSWERAGQIWYQALTDTPPTRTMKMKAFADRTRALAKQNFKKDPAVFAGIDGAWKAVGL